MILRIRIQPGKPGKSERSELGRKVICTIWEGMGGVPEAKPHPAGVCKGWGWEVQRENFKEREAQLEESCP